MSENEKYRLAVIRTDTETAIGIDRIKASSGDLSDISYIASVYIPERLSNREAMKRAVSEVLEIAGRNDVTIKLSAGNSVFYRWKTVKPLYPDVKLFRSLSFLKSPTKLAEDSIKRKSTIKEQL